MSWLLSWPVAASGAACGLAGILGVFLIRGLKHERWNMSLPTALVVFLGMAILPTALLFVAYPFYPNPKPDLTDHVIYLPVAGLSLFWAAFASFKQGIDEAKPRT
jgi:hypothetical protein